MLNAIDHQIPSSTPPIKPSSSPSENEVTSRKKKLVDKSLLHVFEPPRQEMRRVVCDQELTHVQIGWYTYLRLSMNMKHDVSVRFCYSASGKWIE